ncbi:MAG: hypothetical protein GY757_56850 [bacterium]|nr:hypothetical protein [bacterium]
MSIIRKSIAVLIVLFVCIPTLLGIIWSVGITKAVVSPEFLSDLPQEIIEKVPDMIDEVLEEVDREDMAHTANSQAWVKAIVNAETSPKELLGKIGLLDWLENELSDSIDKMGKMLRGEIPLRTIVLNLRPLKEALRHEEIKTYLLNLLKTLPVCDADQLEEWTQAAAAGHPSDLEDLPACRPADLDSAAMAINFVREHEIDDIPDEVNILQSSLSFPKGINMFKSVVSLTYFLFLIPALFIVFAALIAGGGTPGFFRWSGATTFIGGILSFALSSLVKNAIPWAMGIAPEASGVTPFEQLMTGKAGTIGMMFVDQLLSGVSAVAGTVCIVGVVLFALSYILGNNEPEEAPKRKPKTKPGQPQAPKEQPVIEAEFVGESIPETPTESAGAVDGNEDKKLSSGDNASNIKPKE